MPNHLVSIIATVLEVMMTALTPAKLLEDPSLLDHGTKPTHGIPLKSFPAKHAEH